VSSVRVVVHVSSLPQLICDRASLILPLVTRVFSLSLRLTVNRDRPPLGSSIMLHMRSLLRSSRSSRALCAFIAMMAIWNLGCVGFQPLLVHMIGSSASMGMVCDVEGMLAAPTAAPRATNTDASVAIAGLDRADVTVAAAPLDHGAAGHSVSCGCQSCHAPPSALQVVAAAGVSMPLARTRTPVAPPNTIRAPLVPPPQAVI
jgi:hypothetical protein